MDEAERKARGEHPEDERAEVPFVPADAQEVDPRPERVPFDSQSQRAPRGRNPMLRDPHDRLVPVCDIGRLFNHLQSKNATLTA